MNEDICIGFVGLGLIGGSLARTLHKSHPEYRIIAYDADEKMTQRAFAEHAIQEVVPAVDEHFTACDYIFLCAPVLANIAYLCTLKELKKDGCILTDVGSVKTEMHKAVDALGLNDCFIGGHPMAGSEKTGYDHASDRLFENAYYIITPADSVPLPAIMAYSELVSSLGALPLILTYEEHDYITAAVSHLPHVIAASLVNLIQDLDGDEEYMKHIAAGGFKDITRIASSSPVMWQQICLANNGNISKVLDAFIRSLIQYRVYIDNQDADELMSVFEQSRDYRDSMSSEPSGPIKKAYMVYCDIADEAGQIATIATILATNGISIKNIGIVNNREFEEGVLKVEFYEEDESQRAGKLLEARGYTIYER
ncbi:MAG: prephenate dehydrogenase [Lachnospiraceae bacterium]|nr:prephenate dehydrogenase [Lachnospiraceae bacterium]